MTDTRAHLARVHALVAGAARGTGGLTDDAEQLGLFARILDAWDIDIRPMTRSEVADAAGLGGDERFEHLFDVLSRYGALEQHRRKTGTAKWTPHPIALISGELLTSLEHESAADRLADLIVLALDRLDPDADDPPGPEELAAMLDHLTRSVNVVAAQIDRAVDIGTTDELAAARPSGRAKQQVDRVPQAVARMRRAAPTLVVQADRLLEASQRYATATARLVQQLTDNTLAAGASGSLETLFALLTVDEVRDAAARASADELAAVGDDVIFDLPPVTITADHLVAAADHIGDARPPRTPPAVPAGATVDPAAELDRARRAGQARAARLRRWVAAATADGDAVITEDTWPAPMTRLLDAVAVATDRTVPATADVHTGPHVDPDGDVAVSHPLRLRRLGRPAEEPSAPAEEAARG